MSDDDGLIQLVSVPLGDGSATMECSKCGVLDLVDCEHAARLLQEHLATHLTGVPA